MAFRCCVNAICAAIVSAKFREQRPPRAQMAGTFAVAVATWLTVRPGVFSPVPVAELAEEHVGQTGGDQMTLDRKRLADLQVIHAQFNLSRGALKRFSLKVGKGAMPGGVRRGPRLFSYHGMSYQFIE